MATAVLLDRSLYTPTTAVRTVEQTETSPSINVAWPVPPGHNSAATPIKPTNVQIGIPISTGGYVSTIRTPEPVVHAAVVNQPSNVLNCCSLDQWCSPQADDYQFLRVLRSIDPLQWQSVADTIAQQRKGEADDALCKEIVDLATPEDEHKQRIHAAALAVSGSCGLPSDLANLVCQDAQALASTTRMMFPLVKQMIMKLELFGENVCSRWHRDNYVCRALVAYNCSGTDYTVDSNVDLWELENCGNNDHIIRDKSQLYQANVGDIVMIKGRKFPGKASGLIHKSPAVKYHANGEVQTRIVLKVDVQDFAGGEVENPCSGD